MSHVPGRPSRWRVGALILLTGVLFQTSAATSCSQLGETALAALATSILDQAVKNITYVGLGLGMPSTTLSSLAT